MKVWFYNAAICPKEADGLVNSVDPDQTVPDPGLHCLLRPICSNI